MGLMCTNEVEIGESDGMDSDSERTHEHQIRGSHFEISKLADQAFRIEQELMQLEDKMSNLKTLLNLLVSQQLPEVMQRHSQNSAVTASGLSVELRRYLDASIASGRRVDALKWLRSNGYGSVIKATVSFTYRESDNYRIHETLERLEEEGCTLRYSEDISPMTLRAFLEEMIVQGNEFPKELFTANFVSKARVKPVSSV